MPIDGYFLWDKCADRGSRRSDDSRIASQCPFAVLSEPSVARYVTASGVPLLQPPPPLDGPPPRPSLPPRCATLAFLPPMRRAAGARGSTHLPSPETQHTMWSHRGAGAALFAPPLAHSANEISCIAHAHISRASASASSPSSRPRRPIASSMPCSTVRYVFAAMGGSEGTPSQHTTSQVDRGLIPHRGWLVFDSGKVF